MTSPIVRLTSALGTLMVIGFVVFRAPLASGAGDDKELAALIATSHELYAAERYADALAPTRELTQRVPREQVYWRRLAHITRALGLDDEEANAWDRFMDVSPTPWEACPNVADARRRLGDDSRALSAYERCADAAADNADLHLFLGQAYARAGRSADARAAFQRGLDLDEGYADLHLLIGIRDFADGDLPAARRRFNRFLELAPERRPEVAVWLERTKGR